MHLAGRLHVATMLRRRRVQRHEAAERGLLPVDHVPEVPQVRDAELSALDLGEREAGVGVVRREGERGAAVDAAVAALLRVRGEARQARHRPRLERERLLGGELPRALEVRGDADRRDRRVLQPLIPNEVNRERRNVDPRPPAPEPASGIDGRSAPAERVEHEVALVAAGGDDALEQRARLLRRVAEPLGHARTDGRDVRPQILERHPRHLVEIPLVLRHALVGVPEPTLTRELLHVGL